MAKVNSMASTMEPAQDNALRLSERTAVVIITYNHSDLIGECLRTVLANNPGEVIVVDNGSDDGTIETVETEFPEVELVRSGGNIGYGAASNRGVQEASSEYVVVLNPDTRVESNLIPELVKPLAEDERQVTTPRILTYDGEATNTVGNAVHFSGLAMTRGFGDPPDAHMEPKQLAGLSGACFATTREVYQQMGGFEEAIFIYMDDTELSWKANAMDLDISYVPTATVFHEYTGADLDSWKLFHLEQGRYIILRKYLDAKTAALLMPSLLATEALTCGYAVLQGPEGIRSKLRAIVEGFTADVESVDVDSMALVQRLDSQLSGDPFERSRLMTAVMRGINNIYKANISLVSA